MRLVHLFFVLAALCGISAAQETNFPVGPQYLNLTGTTMLRPIATPSISLETPLPVLPDLPQIGPAVSDQPYTPNSQLVNQADLFPIYYGYQGTPVVELANSEQTPELPSSITGVGLTTFADDQSPRKLGYGETVGEAASYWKEHKTSVNHVYTNADIQKLPHR